jgi:hypothetical protein
VAGGRRRWQKHKCRSSLGPPSCAGSEDVTRDQRCTHLTPSVTPLARTSRLMLRRRYSHVAGRRLLADLGSAASSGPRGRPRLPAQEPCCRSPSGSGRRHHRPGNRRHYSGSRNLRHRVSRSWSCGHLLGVHRRARSGATAVVNESEWSVKNWTLALRVLFYRRPDLVRLDRCAPSDLGFL